MPKLSAAGIAKEIRNLKLHGEHLQIIAHGPKRQRDVILANASPELVKALATTMRLLQEKGMRFAPAHQRRARRMISRNTSHKTKKQLVSGKPGAKSRGGGFFQDAAQALITLAPDLIAIYKASQGIP